MNEQTSAAVAKTAGQLLSGKPLRDAEDWLNRCAAGQSTTPEEDTTHSLTLLGVISSVRSVAASALTQRPDKKVK